MSTDPGEYSEPADRVPIGLSEPGWEGVKVGHPGNWTPVIEYEVLPPPPEPEGIRWHLLFIYAAIAGTLIAAVIVGLIIWDILRSVHLSASQAGGHWEPWTGQAFAVLAVGALVALIIHILRS